MPENTVEPVFRRVKPITLVKQRPLDRKKFCIDVCIDDDYWVLYLQQWLTWKTDSLDSRWKPYPLLLASQFVSNGNIAISDRTGKRELWSSPLRDVPTSFQQEANPKQKRKLGVVPLFSSSREMTITYTDKGDSSRSEWDEPILWTLKMVVEYTR
jgi:hypothetical protein